MPTPTSPAVLEYARPTVSRLVVRQTVAIFIDAYRELNARRLFWIVLLLSVLVVAAFMIPGINEHGITLFKFEFPSIWNTHLMSPAQFYKTIFATIAIPLWLAWAAIILALVSTASIFPDFLAGGSVDLYLSKPIGRLRLFLTKYLTGLMFVALQVLAFSAAAFIGIGIRGKDWEFGLFLAVPVVVLLFSYLFSVCVLTGVVTRSTLAAILITLLAWIAFWAVDQAEQTILRFQISQQRVVASHEELARRNQQVIDQIRSKSTTTQSTEDPAKAWVFQKTEQERLRDEAQPTLHKLDIAHDVVFDVKTFLPKTGETTYLLTRWLTQASALPGMDEDENGAAGRDSRGQRRRGPFEPGTIRDFEMNLRGRPVSWIVGTSLGFEAVLVGLAAWTFCRRDY